ncbi:MAG: hypothetical protein E7314_02065 [Clostridiales bacterium]|nr:hypothetical protein [Clostridiales bacterium]
MKTLFKFIAVVAIFATVFGVIIYGNMEKTSMDVETDQYVIESVSVEDGGWLYDDIYVIKTTEGKTIKVIARNLTIITIDGAPSYVSRTIEEVEDNFGNISNRYRCTLYVTESFEIQR